VTTGIINRAGHHLNGKTVTLGGISNHFPKRDTSIAIQSVRDDANQWHSVPKEWVLVIGAPSHSM